MVQVTIASVMLSLVFGLKTDFGGLGLGLATCGLGLGLGLAVPGIGRPKICSTMPTDAVLLAHTQTG